jgi:hypothetical protein
MPDPAVNPAGPVNAIEELLERARSTHEPAHVAAFTEALLAGTLGVAGQKTPDGGFQPLLLDDGGRRVACAYTAPVRFEESARALGFGPDVEVRGRGARLLFAELVPHGFGLLVNHRAGFDRAFTSAEMADLLTAHPAD